MTEPDGHRTADEEMLAALRECADDLEGEIEERYSELKHYPDMMRRYRRDIDVVHRARAAIAVLNAVICPASRPD